MSETVVRADVAASNKVDSRLFDRRLFLAAAILFPLIVLAGFGRTYYFKEFFGTPPLPSNLLHVHGLVMTAWIALFIAQVRFISAKRIKLHQRMGFAGIGLGALIIVTGIPVAVRSGKYGFASGPPDIPPLAFMAVPLFDLVMFALFFGGAIYYRKRPAAHKSLMLLTALNFLPPAVARIPIASLQAFGPLWFFGLPTILAAVCLWLDARRRGRINKVFLTGTVLLIVSYVARLAIMGTGAWMNFAAWLTSFM